ncbi:M56 family metallopeptidase [Mucilaginibacter corticis]|uniref:M56 family metallopeptidase n=1 Tax=Mucilaginibacter corticis TaxID=2597670 RepID=A0A556MXD3_9SPHI|nr:M56 family metallopeptidase [Mucilaginibacter corticis]TSJ44545.1 M56 family metallopeptidase [Mucilaginibacter corticis]
MTSYLISFVLCSGLLLLVYHVFLSRENLYRFNRFYLLFSLVFSMLVPVITVQIPHRLISNDIPIIEHITPVEQQQPAGQFTDEAVVGNNKLYAQQPVVSSTSYQPYLLPGIYIIVALLFLIRFILNLYRLKQKINRSDNLNLGNATLVLLDEDVTPHSFLKYIFINKHQYQNDATEPEIICHEQAHVRQLHSADVVFIELLQVICWFNPFMPFYRKAIQLNHEFLADEAVIKDHTDTPAYQYLLLAKAQQGNSLYLTSQFNYLTIKKRLIMMTKTTSEKTALCKKLGLLPVLAVAALLFSHKVMAYSLSAITTQADKPVKVTEAKKNDPTRPRRVLFATPSGSRTKHSIKDAPKNVIAAYDAILKKYNMQDGYGNIKEISDADTAALHALFVQMSIRQQDGQVVRFSKPLLPMPKNTTSKFWLAAWQKDKNYGVWIDGKRVKNETLANYKADDFDRYDYSRLTPAAIKSDGFRYQVDLMTRAYYADYYKTTMAYRPEKLEPLPERK